MFVTVDTTLIVLIHHYADFLKVCFLLIIIIIIDYYYYLIIIIIGTWFCKECSNCTSCKKRIFPSLNPTKPGTETWKHALVPASDSESIPTYICTFCIGCYLHFEESRYCPICMKVYEEENEDVKMACCDKCDRYNNIYLLVGFMLDVIRNLMKSCMNS